MIIIMMVSNVESGIDNCSYYEKLVNERKMSRMIYFFFFSFLFSL